MEIYLCTPFSWKPQSFLLFLWIWLFWILHIRRTIPICPFVVLFHLAACLQGCSKCQKFHPLKVSWHFIMCNRHDIIVSSTICCKNILLCMLCGVHMCTHTVLFTCSSANAHLDCLLPLTLVWLTLLWILDWLFFSSLVYMLGGVSPFLRSCHTVFIVKFGHSQFF